MRIFTFYSSTYDTTHGPLLMWLALHDAYKNHKDYEKQRKLIINNFEILDS